MAAALVALSTATDARAEEEFNASGGTGSVTVTGKGAWHINLEAPWKVTVGGTSLGKEKWALTKDSATISGVPAGDAKVKIFVCNGGACKNAEVTVKVK